MKMKLTQRIAIGYYKTKIKAIAVVNTRKAAEIAFNLFCTPYSGKPKRKAPAIFHRAEQLTLHLNNLIIRGWKWQPENANGQKILIVHGFDSCSYKFDRYIQPLKQAGFEVIAYDAPAHGISDGKTINAIIYRDTLLAINKAHHNIDIIIAHSLGGLAATLAAEQLNNLTKLVLIAPVTETQTAINNFFSFLPVGDAIKQEMINYIVELRNLPITYYSLSRAIQDISQPVLWLHDEDDWICPFKDVVQVMQQKPPHVQFYVTKGLGHSKIYRDVTVHKTIIRFITSETT